MGVVEGTGKQPAFNAVDRAQGLAWLVGSWEGCLENPLASTRQTGRKAFGW